MKTIQLDKGKRFSNNDKVKFLLLGSDTEPGPVMRRAIKAKVNKTTTEPVSTVWATLGMADDSDVLWSGELKFSETGNDRSVDATGEEVQILREMNKTAIEKSGKKIIEHFISFDDVDFHLGDTFNAGKIPQLRLTLFLQPDEGALVYYEHYETLFAKGEPSEIQYILPEKKDTKNFVHTDRLNYLFDLLPTGEIVETEKKDIFKFLKGNTKRSFIIKALVFPRDNSSQSADGIISNLVKNFLPAKPHRLLFFNATQNTFQDALTNPASSFINPTLKTLLLLHGTFSDTEKSFSGLIDKNNNKPTSWLQDLIIKRKYHQVIAYDHPTIVENAEKNTTALLALLGDIKFAQENPVSIISTSRGGLVAKYIMGTKNIQQNILPVDKAILVACGNGSHYYKTGQHIAKFLSLLRSGFKIMGGGYFLKGIIGAAQFSAEYFLNEPGSLMMTIKKDGSLHSELMKILNMRPQLASTEIYAICDDWDKSLIAEEAKLIRRWISSGADKLIKHTVFDGLEHDWVIANKQQMLMPPSHLKATIQAKSSHTKVLMEGKSKIVNGTSPKEQIKDRIWAILHN
ncbi:MAG: hypothetical protein ACKVPJ_01480 [Chitinophagales bacterium]